MLKGATTPGKDNKLRPDFDDYASRGYVPLREKFDNSVSHALEYYIADWNLSQFASAMGKKKDAQLFARRASGYKHYYDKDDGATSSILPDGKFLTPFHPTLVATSSLTLASTKGTPGTIASTSPTISVVLRSSWEVNVSSSTSSRASSIRRTTTQLMSPTSPTPTLFTYFPKEAWRTQRITSQLLSKYYRNETQRYPRQ